MKDQSKTKQVVIQELASLKQKVDILERREAEFRFLAEGMGDVVFIVDMKLRTTYVSPSIERILGFTSEERATQKLDEQLTPKAQKLVFDTLAAELELEKTEGADKNRSRALELEYYHKDGSIKYLDTYIRGMRDSEGTLTGFYCLSRDITERKQAEEDLQESKTKLQAIFDTVGTGIIIIDKNTQIILEANKTAMEMTGLPQERIIGQICHSLVCPAEVGKCPVKDLGQSVDHSERKLIHADGQLKDILKTVYPITIKGRDCYVESFIDISDRLRAEGALRESEERFRLLAENARDTIWTMDLNLRYTYVSPYIKQLLDYTPEEFMPLSVDEVLTPSSLELCMQVFAEELEIEKKEDKDLLRSKTVEVEEISKNGSIVPCEIKMTFMRDNAGQATGILGYTLNITERKQAEEKLHQTLDSLRKAFGTIIQVMVSAVESRDPYTAGHQSKSADLARAIAAEMGLSQDKIDGIHMAGSIHDIGKLSIPAEILSKPTKLTEIEFSLIKEHSRKGYEMLKDVESPWPLAEIVYQHHERMDGSGYPKNLKGDDILMDARILAVADVVESMASHRPYRAGLGIDVALKEIENNKETLYDADAVAACLRLFREKGFRFE